jgi:TolB-like protein/DNA-binding SARP family transcriptional activator
MLSIHLFGGFELTLTDGSTSGHLGSKPQGLLAFLAMSRGAAVPRGQLAGLLWGERDEEHARHSLSQALTTIRAALGPAAAVLQSGPDGLQLARDGVELDVDLFESAVRSRTQATLQTACDLYRGEFLDKVDIREPDFEDWLLSERYRLGELAIGAFDQLLDLQIAAGDVEAAIAPARRLVAMAPLDESAHARLIELYAGLGRRGLAEAHYARCEDLLRRELGRAPGEELQAALAEARRSPGKSASFTSSPTGSDPQVPDNRSQNAARTRKAGRVAAAAAATALLVLAGIWTYYGNWIGDADESSGYQDVPWGVPAEPSIAVMPFENLSNDPERTYFADGITNDIITDLSKFSNLLVIASDSSSRFRDAAMNVKEVARDLGVRYVLEGSVQLLDSTLKIDANLIDATTGRHVWGERYERPADNLFTVQKEITQTIVSLIGSGFGELQRAEIERVRNIPTEDLQAYHFYVRGMASSKRGTRESNALAREMFEKAIQADPNYARAMAEYSLTYLFDLFNGWADSGAQWLERAEQFARRAMETDSSEPWGFVALGLVNQLNVRNEQALPLFETAHALNPNDYGVKQALGYAVTFAGAAERGVELLERAQRLNPYHTKWSALAMAYFFAHRYEDSLREMNKITLPQGSTTFWLYKAAAYAQLGRMDEARAAIAAVLELDSTLTAHGEYKRRLALGLTPAYAEHFSEALRKAGLPERGTP